MTAEVFYGGTWVDRSDYLTTDPVVMTRGYVREAADAPPANAPLVWRNHDRVMNPYDPVSPLYGLAGMNSPVRIKNNGVLRFEGEIPAWTPRREFVQATARVESAAAGLLRRVGKVRRSLRSPLERAVLADGDVLAYWPLTDQRDSDLAGSGLPAGDPMTELGAVNFAQVAGPAGSPANVPEFIDGGTWVGSLVGNVEMPAGTTEWSVDWWFRATRSDAALEAFTPALSLFLSGGAFGQFAIYTRFEESFVVLFEDRDGIGTGSVQIASATPYDGLWHHLRVDVRQSGGGANTDIEFFMDGASVDTFTAAGVKLGLLTRVEAGNLSGAIPFADPENVESVSLAHIVVRTGSFGAGTDYDPGIGHTGEYADDRFLRVCAENGIPASVRGTANDTVPMGPQTAGTLIDTLRECGRTDGGLIVDGFGELVMVLLRSMCNQDPVLELDAADPGVGLPLDPTTDDSGIRNDVTASRPAGASARAELTVGPKSVQDPPDGVTRYDETWSVNPQTDVRLLDAASWRVSTGTYPLPRWEAITVDLRNAEGLTAAVEAVEIGDRVTVANVPAELGTPDGIDVIVIGISEAAGTSTRTVTFHGVPAAPYEIGIVGDDAGSTDLRGQRVSTELSTVDGDHVAADSTILIDSGGQDWTTDPDDWNPALSGGGMFLDLAGELVRVTGIAGAGSAWTLTVARAQNGVAKTIPDGTPVRFRYPIIVGH